MLRLRRKPTRHYTPEQRNHLAHQYDTQARIDDTTAHDLETAGRHDEAQIHRNTAREWRDLADAARTSSRALALLTT